MREAAARAVDARARRRRARLRRGDHVPLRRPLAQRPGQVPARGRARPLARARPARRCSAPGSRPTASRPRRSTSSRRRSRGSWTRWSSAGSRRRSPSRRDVRGVRVTRELAMPKLSDSNEESVILRWLKGAGEPFARGEPLAEIETDKATVVYEAESDGVLASIVVAEGGAARPGQPIATLDDVATPAAAPPPRAAGRAPAPARGRSTSAARSARRSTRRSPPTSAWSSSARTSRSPAACSRSRPGCTRSTAPSASSTRRSRSSRSPGAAFGSAVNGLRPGGRDHVRRLPAARDGQRREPDVEVLVPDAAARSACRS